ncbi:type IV pilus secretin PilQ [Facilibium subflavum]|uniref:type IV pilus secretin PilQ n=1 Tax=Facilibium subflavum TaxID=2219058 RepID=UPI0013C3610A|nr:type IV pilus secretin PilQ [Facilibium subflavum]
MKYKCVSYIILFGYFVLAGFLYAKPLVLGKYITLDIDVLPYVDQEKTIQKSPKEDSLSYITPLKTDEKVNEAQDKNTQHQDMTTALQNLAKVENITYKRRLNNGGVLSLTLPSTINPVVAFDKKEDALVITLKNAKIDENWLHRIDMGVFNTIASSLDVEQQATDLKLTLTITAPFIYQKQQTENLLEILIDKKQSEVGGFNVNKKITLKFQGISVRALLQTLSQFAGFNLVISEGVGGEISLNLKDVPWEDALNIVLASKGLGKKQMGNILYIAPISEIAKQNEQEVAAKKALELNEPLKTEYIKLNYAKAQQIADLLTKNTLAVLSARGDIIADNRMNMLVVTDTEKYLKKLAAMVESLDQPLDQVLIEARIVEVSKSSVFELGLGYKPSDPDKPNININVLPNYIEPSDGKSGSTNADITFFGLFGDIELKLELSALETEGNAKVVSSPHLIVSENTEAYIKQGKEIPYQESSASGAASIAFKEAVLELRVVPQIAPNGYVVLEVTLTKDAETTDSSGVTNQPILDKREIKTKLMVKDGQTIVLGGIYEKTKTRDRSKVPLLGDIPLLGWLFSSVSNKFDNKELLIFITPRVIKQDLENEKS